MNRKISCFYRMFQKSDLDYDWGSQIVESLKDINTFNIYLKLNAFNYLYGMFLHLIYPAYNPNFVQ